ncbi:Elongation factor 2 [Bienertia sinuspersici]
MRLQVLLKMLTLRMIVTPLIVNQIDRVETQKKYIAKKKAEGQELNKGRCLSSLQAQFEKRMDRMNLSNGPTNINQEAKPEGSLVRSKRYGKWVPGNQAV